MFKFDLTAWILNAIPSGFWPGLILGVIVTGILGIVGLAVIRFLCRHFKLIVLICVVISTIIIVISAL